MCISFTRSLDFCWLYLKREGGAVLQCLDKVTLLDGAVGVCFRLFAHLSMAPCVLFRQYSLLIPLLIVCWVHSEYTGWLGGYRQDNSRSVGNVIHSLMPDLLLCMSIHTHTYRQGAMPLLSSQEETWSFYSPLSLWGKPRYNSNLSNCAIDTL